MVRGFCSLLYISRNRGNHFHGIFLIATIVKKKFPSYIQLVFKDRSSFLGAIYFSENCFFTNCEIILIRVVSLVAKKRFAPLR